MFIWSAFWDLNSERRNQEGHVGSILWTAMNQYAYRYNITETNEFDSFVYLISKLDNEFRDIQNKDIKAQRELRKPVNNKKR